jgi:hypothetical protein
LMRQAHSTKETSSLFVSLGKLRKNFELQYGGECLGAAVRIKRMKVSCFNDNCTGQYHHIKRPESGFVTTAHSGKGRENVLALEFYDRQKTQGHVVAGREATNDLSSVRFLIAQVCSYKPVRIGDSFHENSRLRLSAITSSTTFESMTRPSSAKRLKCSAQPTPFCGDLSSSKNFSNAARTTALPVVDRFRATVANRAACFLPKRTTKAVAIKPAYSVSRNT